MIAKKYLNAKSIAKIERHKGDLTNAAALVRQRRVAQEILTLFQRQKGVLLADDTGLGKTWTAALVALTIARNGGQVLILVPNNALLDKWEKDISMVRGLTSSFESVRVRIQSRDHDKWNVSRIAAQSIVIATHSYFGKNERPNHRAHLLIVDEAHRSKGDQSKFKESVHGQADSYKWFLFLTATPFSINVQDLCRLIDLVSGASCEVRSRALRTFADYTKAPSDFVGTKYVGDPPQIVWKNAVKQLKPWVIRHTIKDLKRVERRAFGDGEPVPWIIDVGAADTKVLEILARTDRLLNLKGAPIGVRGSDPRFHVGWNYLSTLMASQPNAEWTEDQQNRNTELDSFIKTSPPFVKEHALQIRNFLRHAKHHKIARVALAIMDRVAENEKVVVFCHHHATMLELSEALYALEKNTAIKKTNAIAPELWRETWVALLTKKLPDDPDLLACASTFVCADSFRTQASSWLDESRDFTERADLTKALSETRVRRYARAIVGVPTILQAVLSILKWESHDVGNDREARVKTSVPSALRQHEWPSTVTSVGDDLNATLALFNTPFGPDVLVATDKLSEGIDLHGCCRILVHYELDPSPVRVRQREGRIRRIGSWAGKTGSAVEYAYPAYMGTRDETLVRIVKKRLAQFDLLLGGAPDVDDHDSRTKENAMFNSLEELKKLVEADIRGCLISPLGI